MEKLQTLLFELSSNERMRILLGLQQQKLKLSQISRQYELTIAETSRHLQRLTQTKLIQKNQDSQYELTPYGKLAIIQTQGLKTISNHQEYFTEYNPHVLQQEFINRISELSQAKFYGEPLQNIQHAGNLLQETKKTLWIISDQILPFLVELVRKKTGANIDIRVILPTNIMPPDDNAPIPSTVPGVQKRTLEKTPIVMILNENTARLALPNYNNKMDYRGLGGTDKIFHKWCQDLFLYYWQQATPVTQK